jgi:hypothetical protein
MLARVQFGLKRDGKCGAIITYPIKGYPWHHNPTRSYEFQLTTEEASELFEEVTKLPQKYPEECLNNEVLWSDQSEKANGITRHVKTGKLCHTIGIFRTSGKTPVYFSMEEDSTGLRESRLYKTVSALISPYKVLPAKQN